MAARESIKILRDRFEADLQNEIDGLTVVSGDSAPTIQEYRDPFTDDVLEPNDWPAIVIDLAPISSPEAELPSQGKADISVPVDVRYVSHDYNTAEGRRRASYCLRAIIRVLDIVHGRVEAGMRSLQVTDLTFDYFVDEEEHIQAVTRFTILMRDEGV